MAAQQNGSPTNVLKEPDFAQVAPLNRLTVYLQYADIHPRRSKSLHAENRQPRPSRTP
jgi:hypothetical protein